MKADLGETLAGWLLVLTVFVYIARTPSAGRETSVTAPPASVYWLMRPSPAPLQEPAPQRADNLAPAWTRVPSGSAIRASARALALRAQAEAEAFREQLRAALPHSRAWREKTGRGSGGPRPLQHERL